MLSLFPFHFFWSQGETSGVATLELSGGFHFSLLSFHIYFVGLRPPQEGNFRWLKKLEKHELIHWFGLKGKHQVANLESSGGFHFFTFTF